VLCFKSQLHLNQDGIRFRQTPATSTLPVKELFSQIADEAKPDVLITAGTAGGVFQDQNLGDVVVTRAAKFRLQDEFKNGPFNNKKYESHWQIPTKHFADAVQLMVGFKARFKSLRNSCRPRSISLSRRADTQSRFILTTPTSGWMVKWLKGKRKWPLFILF